MNINYKLSGGHPPPQTPPPQTPPPQTPPRHPPPQKSGPIGLYITTYVVFSFRLWGKI
jgi:hypothetical protein